MFILDIHILKHFRYSLGLLSKTTEKINRGVFPFKVQKIISGSQSLKSSGDEFPKPLVFKVTGS